MGVTQIFSVSIILADETVFRTDSLLLCCLCGRSRDQPERCLSFTPRKDVNFSNVIPKVRFCTLEFGIRKIRFQPLCKASLNILAKSKTSFWNPPLQHSSPCFFLSRKASHGPDQRHRCALARPCGPRARVCPDSVRDPRGVTGPPGSVPGRVRSHQFHLVMLCIAGTHFYSKGLRVKEFL